MSDTEAAQSSDILKRIVKNDFLVSIFSHAASLSRSLEGNVDFS